MQMILVTHLTEGCIVVSQLCYQGGEVFGRHENNRARDGFLKFRATNHKELHWFIVRGRQTCLLIVSCFHVADSAGDILFVMCLRRGLKASFRTKVMWGIRAPNTPGSSSNSGH